MDGIPKPLEEFISYGRDKSRNPSDVCSIFGQLDNNQFNGSAIPPSYRNMSHLLKLSLRNCSLRGAIPDLSTIPELGYLDLSRNQLSGSIPQVKLSVNITTIDLSNNLLTGNIPSNFSGLPLLQRLSLENNQLNGSVPSNIWQNTNFNSSGGLVLDFQNNSLSSISGALNPPANVSIWLKDNPVCTNANQLNISRFCGSKTVTVERLINTSTCPSKMCPTQGFFEYVPTATTCVCALPIRVGYRLKSPGFSDFRPYVVPFEVYLTSGLELEFNQLYIDSFAWEVGPRLRMYLKIFPPPDSPEYQLFNTTEILRIEGIFTGWNFEGSSIFGPYELLNFTLQGIYESEISPEYISSSGISKAAVAGIVLGCVAIAVTISAIISILIMRKRTKDYHAVSKKRLLSRVPMKIDGVKDFTFGEMAHATNNFSNDAQVGQGGYGKVYKGILADGTIVAIKRAQEGSLQGQREFFTEIELLSRLHHRNLVSLLGYCDEAGEQMLVYEFMPNGTLRDHLSAKAKESLSFAMRLHIAMGSSRGILYLHNEADPPILHRDIKASNILLDFKFVAKVADFGLSKLALASDIEGTAPAHVSTVLKGTPGYLDPEYFLTQKLTDKSDVYSLGVVFLELLTGMQPIMHGKNMVREVNIAYQSGMMFSVIDPRMGPYPSECVGQFVKLALKCCQDETDGRPSMAEVVRELEDIWKMTPESDTGISESINIENEKSEKAMSSASEIKNPYVSSDISGSDLVSSVVPTITPR